MLRGKIPHFRLTCVAQKRRCLSSLMLANIDTSNDVVQWRIQGRRRPPFFLGQTEARRAEKNFGDSPRPPYLRVWMTPPPPPPLPRYPEGLDTPLLYRS